MKLKNLRTLVVAAGLSAVFDVGVANAWCGTACESGCSGSCESGCNTGCDNGCSMCLQVDTITHG